MKYFELTSNYQNCSPHTSFTNSELAIFFDWSKDCDDATTTNNYCFHQFEKIEIGN